jgi:hypothetical protein
MFRILVLTQKNLHLKSHTLLQAASIVIGFLLSVSAPHAAAPEVSSVDLWQPQVGDRVIFDTLDNIGYITHANGEFISFPIVTGQNRVVHYIGLTYNAATPVGEWTAKSRHIKGDRITYGGSGRFLRLYKDGEEYTHYGIHTHAYEDVFFARDPDKRFRSMGCIIVKENIYDIIEETYSLNGERLQVTTKYGLDGDEIAMR